MNVTDKASVATSNDTISTNGIKFNLVVKIKAINDIRVL